MKLLTLAAFALTAPHAHASVDTPRFLAAITQVEGHKWSDPGGAYAIQRATWEQYSQRPYARASIKEFADEVAALHLARLARSLAAEGWRVDAYTLGGCWRWGFEGFKARSKIRGSLEYGERVANLYHARR